jgi:DNA repair photolyase
VKKKKLKIIYEPRGRAGEYADLALNLSTGCSHGCAYCYCPAVLRIDRADFHNRLEIKPRAFERLEHDLELLRGDGDTRRVQLSFIGDPYCSGMEPHTRRALEMFLRFGIPFQILTKGGMRAVRDFELYVPCDRFGVSLTFADPWDASKLEPHAAPTAERISSLRMAHEDGIKTWVSLEPVIDGGQTLALIRKTAGFVDEYKVGKVSGYKSRVKDWKRFGNQAVELLEKLGKRYTLKKDLKEAMGS